MKFIDEVETPETPSVEAINKALSALTLEGDWTIIRQPHVVAAHEGKTGNAHFFLSHDPTKMANELFVRDREIFHPVGDTWS